MAFKELDATLQAAGCGQPADRAPLVEITRGPDGTSFVLAANPTHEFGVVTSHPETAAVEITDPTAAGLPAEATVNGRHLRDALRDHNAAEQKSLTAADIQFPDGETSVSVGRSAADRAQPDIADELRLATAKKMLDAVAEPRWRQGTTARSFAAEGARIAACASKDKDRPIMTRVAVGEWNGVKRLVSTNGHMLAVTQENLPEGLPKETMLRASDLTAFEKTVNAHLGNRDAALGMSNGAVDGVDVHGFHVGQELTAKIFDRLAREALEVAERAVAAASAVERIDALAEQVWEVLREAPYGSFGDEPWDALQAAQSVADKAMTGPHLALEPPNDPHEHTEVFPLLAVALGALHAATHPGASINDRFSNWNCSEASSR